MGSQEIQHELIQGASHRIREILLTLRLVKRKYVPRAIFGFNPVSEKNDHCPQVAAFQGIFFLFKYQIIMIKQRFRLLFSCFCACLRALAGRLKKPRRCAASPTFFALNHKKRSRNRLFIMMTWYLFFFENPTFSERSCSTTSQFSVE